jgi:hypothetical protein
MAVRTKKFGRRNEGSVYTLQKVTTTTIYAPCVIICYTFLILSFFYIRSSKFYFTPLQQCHAVHQNLMKKCRIGCSPSQALHHGGLKVLPLVRTTHHGRHQRRDNDGVEGTERVQLEALL